MKIDSGIRKIILFFWGEKTLIATIVTKNLYATWWLIKTLQVILWCDTNNWLVWKLVAYSHHIKSCVLISGSLFINQTILVSDQTLTTRVPLIHSTTGSLSSRDSIDRPVSTYLGTATNQDLETKRETFGWAWRKSTRDPGLASAMQARFEMFTELNQSVDVEYGSFSLESESSLYRIHVAGYTGDLALDPMNCWNVLQLSNAINNGMPFATLDRDNDNKVENNCALDGLYGGGSWWNNCHCFCLNGLYDHTGEFNSVAFGYNMDINNPFVGWRKLVQSRMMIKCNWDIGTQHKIYNIYFMLDLINVFNQSIFESLI